MFDVAPSELLLVALVALVVIGPKDLPRAMSVVGRWVGRARGMARHFRAGLDEMVRQAELEEMEDKQLAFDTSPEVYVPAESRGQMIVGPDGNVVPAASAAPAPASGSAPAAPPSEDAEDADPKAKGRVADLQIVPRSRNG